MSRPNRSKPAASSAQAPPPPRPRRRWPRYVACGLIIVAAALAGLAYYQYSRSSLPLLGDFASFQNDSSAARRLCRLLQLPELPDLSRVDVPGQRKFHEALCNLREHPGRPEAYGRLGQLYQAQQFPQQSIDCYRKAIGMAPDDFKWHYALGVQLAESGELEGADTALQRAAELGADYAPVWMRLTWRAMDRNDMAAALDCANRYVRLRPRDPLGYVERARILLYRQEWPEMQRNLGQAQSLGPIGKQGHRLLGVLHKHLGHGEDSEFHLLMSAEEQAGGLLNDPVALEVEQLKTYRDPLVLQFRSLLERERYREATTLADRLLAGNKDTPDYGLICGDVSMCYRGINDYESARRYAEMARDALPDQAVGYVNLAFALGGMGQYDQALVEANRALQIDPLDASARYVRGTVRVEMAVRDHLADTLQKQAESDPRVVQAVADLAGAVERRPLEVQYLKALARAHALLKQYEQADRVVTRALRVAPDREDLLDLKARIQAKESLWPEPEGRR